MDRVNELLRSLKSGNTSAFNELYKSYWPYIYKAATYWTNDHDLAQDIAQDVFYKIWRIRRDLPDHADKNYLFMSARNRTYEHYDKMKRRNRLQKRYFEDKEEVVPPAQRLETTESQMELQNTLSTLTPATANIFRLIYSEEIKAKVVAAQLGLKLQTVRNAVTAGRKLLRAKMNGHRKGL